MRQVYLHGLGQTADSWTPVLQRLDVVGESVCPELTALVSNRNATYQNLYAAVSTLCDSLDEPLDLCGLSLGGVLALHYAIDHPDHVRTLALIAAPYRMPKTMLRIQNLLFWLMPSSQFQSTGFSKIGMIQLCKSMMPLDFRDDLPKVVCPTLVLCGEKDSANRRSSEELADRLPNAEFLMMKDAGHEVNRDAPAALAAALRSFRTSS